MVLRRREKAWRKRSRNSVSSTGPPRGVDRRVSWTMDDCTAGGGQKQVRDTCLRVRIS
jgi:hypothetical protein